MDPKYRNWAMSVIAFVVGVLIVLGFRRIRDLVEQMFAFEEDGS